MSFCGALDAHGSHVVGKLEGGEPSAELFVCCRLGFYLCLLCGCSPHPRPRPFEQISASPS